jgi:hypothetical protein
MSAKKKRTKSTPALAAKKKPPTKTADTAAAEAKRAPAATAAPVAKKPSALDAAALVLRESGRPLSCPELIQQMAATGIWSSPKGKTPAATLYAALMREVQRKGDAARFVKTGPGRFAYRGTP